MMVTTAPCPVSGSLPSAPPQACLLWAPCSHSPSPRCRFHLHCRVYDSVHLHFLDFLHFNSSSRLMAILPASDTLSPFSPCCWRPPPPCCSARISSAKTLP